MMNGRGTWFVKAGMTAMLLIGGVGLGASMTRVSAADAPAAPAASAAPDVTAAESFQAVSDGEIAAKLGLLLGEGSGVTEAYLMKPTTRIQAAILSLRLKGQEQEAWNYSGTDNFSDANLVGMQNQRVMAYLKAHPESGWIGMGKNKMDPLATVTPQEFYKVLLEGLGYQTGVDYGYEDTISFAKSKGLYRISTLSALHNRDLATSMVEALQAMPKGGDKAYAEKLRQSGLIPKETLDSLGYTRLETVQDAKLGTVLTDSKGMMLYYFTKDAANPNACQGKCLEAWPIYDADKLQVPAGLNGADFGRFQRSDGKMQITYKGWPLYYYAGDQVPGDTSGENVGKVWFVLKIPAYSVMIGTKSELGNYLTDAEGRTLYYFDKDPQGVSTCSGNCLKAWPAFHADSFVVPTGVDPADFGQILRTDGTYQSTYKGYPLYHYTPDVNRGDTTGQDVNKVWFVIQPASFKGTTAQQAAGGK